MSSINFNNYPLQGCNVWLGRNIQPIFNTAWNENKNRLIITNDRNKEILKLTKTLYNYKYTPDLCNTWDPHDFSIPSRSYCKKTCDFRYFSSNDLTELAIQIYDSICRVINGEALRLSLFYPCYKRIGYATLRFEGDIPASISKVQRSSYLPIKPCPGCPPAPPRFSCKISLNWRWATSNKIDRYPICYN